MNGFNQMKYLLVQILEDLTVMGNPVDILTEFPPGEHLPAVTMNTNGGRGHLETIVYKNMNTLPCYHPYFDLQAPETLYNTEELIKHVFEAKLLLHIWFESNEERDILVEKILHKILKDKNKVLNRNLFVQIRDIGAVSDIDQFDSFPPLFHTTIEVDFIYIIMESQEVIPLCKITKER